ncbi:MAG TPA: C40 family peptidase [Nakamurella sp.]|nr:C40 family peptidase [Nakamurella sp.]
MATQVPSHWPRSITVLVTAVLFISLAVALPAGADPGTGGSSTSSSTPPVQPSTSDQAKKAWLDASDQAEIANEDLLAAREHEKDAKAAAAKARVAVARTHLQATTAETTAVRAAAKYSAYRSQLSQFASASYRGARLGQLSALLTARSSSDYLDEVASLDQVAGHTRELMAEALVAKKAADAAAAKADKAQRQAATAKAKADAAVTNAQRATKTVTERKATLDAQVTKYHKLFDSLTVQEREAAMAAQQAAWEEQAQREQEAQASLLAARQQQEQERAAAQQQREQEQAQPLAAADPAPATTSSAAPPASSSAAAKVAAPTTRSKAQLAVAAALTRLGYPYIYGAAGPNAFDCSGLTSWAWAQAGVTIPRTSAGQATLPYVPLDQLQPGDLVTYYSPVHHVALYIGNGQIIDASTESKPIFITSVYRGGPNPTGHRVNY